MKPNRLSLLLWVYAWLQITVVTAQQRVDSVSALPASRQKDTVQVNTALRLGTEMRSVNLDSSKHFFSEAIALARQLSFWKGEVRALNALAISCGMMDQYADAIDVFQTALATANRHQLPLQAGDSYNGLGIVYKRLGDYSGSLSFYSKALGIYDSLNHDPSRAACRDNMAILYDLMKEDALARTYFRDALSIYDQSGDTLRSTLVRSNLAVHLLRTGELDEAISILVRNLEYYTENNKRLQESEEALNLGNAFFTAGRFTESKKMANHSLVLADSFHLEQIQVEALCLLANVHARLNEFRAAVDVGLRACAKADALEGLALKSKAFYALSHAYEKSGDFKRALSSFQQHKRFEDSLFNQNKSQAFMHQQVLLQVRDKDEQLRDQALQLVALDREVALETRWKVMLAITAMMLLIVALLYYQKYRTRIRHSRELEQQNFLIRNQKDEIEEINQQLQQQIVLRKESGETINYFASSLFGKNTIDEILWDVAKNCIVRLRLVDCVIYLVDEDRKVLVQKAAFGAKNPGQFHIKDPIEIPLGKGIVGSVAVKGVAEIVNDTSKDDRYIVDDETRNSELAVPLVVQNKVIGVIDSEHPDRNFFTLHHLESLTTIAAICASKIFQAEADQQANAAREIQREAEHIKKLDKIKSQFFANISHEFRTPLNLILAPLQKEGNLLPPEISMMTRNAKRLLRLVNQLLDLARIEVGMLETRNSFVNVFAFISDIANSFNLIAETGGKEYRVDVPTNDFVAGIDVDKLEKIVYNLLSNAFKFTPKGGAVSIVAKASDGVLKIHVGDNGIGIPKHLHNNIFDRFFQADASQTRSYEGSGIGLALTRELVDLMGGAIAVISDEGKGSLFMVTLPLAQMDVNEMTVSDPEVIDRSEDPFYIDDPSEVMTAGTDTVVNPELPVVLVVEDNADLRAYLHSLLSPSYNVLTAADGSQGLNIAKDKIPDLIVSDIMMPVMDGVSLTRKLRTDDRTYHIPIILLTARSDIESKLQGFETGAEQYLVKPFRTDELVAAIRVLVERQDRLKKKYTREFVVQPSEVVIQDRDATFLQRVIGCVEANLTEKNFSIDQLQQQIGMSRMQLHRKLKALTNQSASDFVRTIRLKRAAQLLSQPGMQVAEAAFLSGFNHLSYFSRCFREQYGVLPSDYLKTVTNP